MKTFSLLLIASLFLSACNTGSTSYDSFNAYEINNCGDYFNYLYAGSAEERQKGQVNDLTCVGVVDYEADEIFSLGLIIQTDEYGERRIGLHMADGDDSELIEQDGVSVSVTGDLYIHVYEDSGAGLWVEEWSVL